MDCVHSVWRVSPPAHWNPVIVSSFLFPGRTRSTSRSAVTPVTQTTRRKTRRQTRRIDLSAPTAPTATGLPLPSVWWEGGEWKVWWGRWLTSQKYKTLLVSATHQQLDQCFYNQEDLLEILDWPPQTEVAVCQIYSLRDIRRYWGWRFNTQ